MESPAGADRLKVLVLPTADITAARKTLDDARAELDVAVAALPNINGDEAMATPALVTLLVSAVRAKDHLSKLEALLSVPAEPLART
jgi:hypothetical protein